MTDHQRQRDALGAYVLGALDPAERHEVDQHLSTCPYCRDELARLSALPQLLGRLSPEEASDDRLLPPADLRPRVSVAAATETRRLHRQIRRWRRTAFAAASAAAVLLVVLVFPLERGGPALEPPLVADVIGVSDEAERTDGHAAAYAWEWGTTVELQLAGLPQRDRYVVYTVAEDGRREQTGTWGPTAARAAHVRSASSIEREDLRRVEVTDDTGTVLFAFEFDA